MKALTLSHPLVSIRFMSDEANDDRADATDAPGVGRIHGKGRGASTEDRETRRARRLRANLRRRKERQRARPHTAGEGGDDAG